MNNKAIEIINKASDIFPDFKENFEDGFHLSSEIVIFGSFAYGCENSRSDIDILFVGDGVRKASRRLDFIWRRRERIESKTWLGSELANHIAEYGVWMKGTGAWRDSVFYSESAILRKKGKIFRRLTHLLLRKDRLSHNYKKQLLQKIILNIHRLKMLYERMPNPPTCIEVQLIQEHRDTLFRQIFSQRYLGKVGRVMFEEIFPNTEIINLLCEISDELFSLYMEP
jgi:predicted nucleotidyltransferase